MANLVTLTTDFGTGSSYVAAMKGALLAVSPQAYLVDLSHSIAPQDVRQAAYFLQSTVPYFPAGTLHVVVVDPGVGTDRAILYVEVGGQRLLVPDNGCWISLCRPDTAPELVVRVTAARYWRSEVSATFHGRDIFAPVAGHLSLGLEPRSLGQPVSSWVRLDLPAPRTSAAGVIGEVIIADPFGNLVTNIPGAALTRWGDRPVQVALGGRPVTRRVRTYGEAAPGELVVLISSMGTVEVAVSHGSAAARLGAGVGTTAEVTPR
jgi:S-adenosylmethionine hydrolase